MLLKKLKEFGLIFAISSESKNQTIEICHSLKKADNPVVLFDFSIDREINQVRISNENEDMFIGARCPCDFKEIKEAFLSGAHFVLTPPKNTTIVKQCLSDGFDLIAEVSSKKEIDLIKDLGGEALAINVDDKNFDSLINYTLSETKLSLFLRGEKENMPFDQWRNTPQIIAFIIDKSFEIMAGDSVYIETISTINQILGFKYISLSLRDNSERLDEARIFSSLSALPLITGSDRDQLTIGVHDMDRMISHLKWKDIYIDPFSAKMKGNIVLETELYTDFLGWNVRLINCN